MQPQSLVVPIVVLQRHHNLQGYIWTDKSCVFYLTPSALFLDKPNVKWMTPNWENRQGSTTQSNLCH
jgi:hypothetical protein